MKDQLLRLGRTAAIYGIGSILNRFISFLLLPLFTKYLTPTDYGISSILGWMTFLLAPIFSLGMGTGIATCYYEKEGLLPSSRRLNNSHSVYADSDIPWVTLISCLRSTGMSITDLKHYAELCQQGEKTVQERKQIILHQKKRLEEQLEQVKQHLELINKKNQPV